MIKLNLKNLFIALMLMMSLNSLAQSYTYDQVLTSMKESLNSGKSEVQIVYTDFYQHYEKASKLLQNHFDKKFFKEVVETLPYVLEHSKNFQIIESFAPVYVKNKKAFDEIAKEVLNDKNEKDFYERLEIAVNVYKNGNG